MYMSINYPSFLTPTVSHFSFRNIYSMKPRFLCLHGFRTSGEILKKQIIGKWDSSIVDKLDLVFVDAPFPAQGKSDVEAFFDPPFFEWYQSTKNFTGYINFEKCLAYIEDCMLKYGPFDGLLGFSQGAILSAALPGLQDKGMALGKVDRIKALIIIGGGKSQNPSIAEKAYSPKIQIPSLHFLGYLDNLTEYEIDSFVILKCGLRSSNTSRVFIYAQYTSERDFLKNSGIELLESFINPVVINHPQGHTIPRLDEKSSEIMCKFIERIQKQVTPEEERAFPENV